MSEQSSGAIGRIRTWVRRKLGTELPCGCIATCGRDTEYSNDTTVVNREFETVQITEYTNATKKEKECHVTIQCDYCSAQWTETKSGGRSVDYGDQNPDAHAAIETKMKGRFVTHQEVPVVDRGDDS